MIGSYEKLTEVRRMAKVDQGGWGRRLGVEGSGKRMW